MYSLVGIIVGALAGLVVTVAVTMLWPRGVARWARSLVAAGLGVGVAYVLMLLIK
ncbi:MAG TPA: hypothetical protein VNT75_08630 [Symbiobacteriaceae bacterium]|nr:hypothetical protein [Symbiobacteriaceae bacterium]